MKWWMRCICHEDEATKPRSLPGFEGIVAEAPAKSSPGRVQISPVKSDEAEKPPFNDVSIRQLEELLDEINKVRRRQFNVGHGGLHSSPDLMNLLD